MVIVLMGVSGVGKTTVGQALAADMGWMFADGDDYHPAANIAKMRAGIPLDDADRTPWLGALRTAIGDWLQRGDSVVLACSALKNSYRKQLLFSPAVRLVYLRGSHAVIAARLAARHGHYMNPDLLRSQFEALEEPADAIIVSADQSVPQVVTDIQLALGLHSSHQR
jgi:gluconokinase